MEDKLAGPSIQNLLWQFGPGFSIWLMQYHLHCYQTCLEPNLHEQLHQLFEGKTFELASILVHLDPRQFSTLQQLPIARTNFNLSRDYVQYNKSYLSNLLCKRCCAMAMCCSYNISPVNQSSSTLKLHPWSSRSPVAYGCHKWELTIGGNFSIYDMIGVEIHSTFSQLGICIW